MPAKIYIRRGSKADLNTILGGTPLASGELGFTTDTHEVYVGDGAQHYLAGKGEYGTTAERDAWDVTSASGKFWVSTDENNKLSYYTGTQWVGAGITDLADMSGTLDDIADGSTYGKVLNSVLTSGTVNQLDDGTYNVTASGLYDHINDADKHRLINDSGTSTIDLWSATKIQSEINAAAAGLDTKESVKAIATTSGTLSSAFENGDSVDGYTLQTGDRIILAGNGAENGIYEVAASGAPSRTSDFANGDTVANAYAWVEEGTNYADSGWVVTNDQPNDVVGTDDIVWTQFTGLGQIVAGSGLIKTANTLDVNPGSGIYIDGDTVAIKIDTVTGGNVAAALTATDDGLGVNIDDLSIKENGSNQLYVDLVDGGSFV